MRKWVSLLMVCALLIFFAAGCKKETAASGSDTMTMVTMETTKFGENTSTTSTVPVDSSSYDITAGKRASLEDVKYYDYSKSDGPVQTDVDYDAHTTKVRRIENEKALWECTIKHTLFDDGFILTTGGVIVYGTATENEPWVGVIAFIDNSGSILCEQTYHYGETARFEKAVADENGITVFGNGYVTSNGTRKWSVVIRRYDFTGHVIFSKEIAVEQYGTVSAAARIKSDYLIRLRQNEGSGCLWVVSESGSPIKKLSYLMEGKELAVQDIAYSNGRIYLSCMMEETGSESFNKEFNGLMDTYYKAWEKYNDKSLDAGAVPMPADYNKKLIELFQKQYTSVLLICNKEGVPQKAAVVREAKCDKLTASGNFMKWNVIRIDEVKNACPLLSSRRVDMAATGFDLLFSNGKYSRMQADDAVPLMY